MRQREILLVHDIDIVKEFIKQQLCAELNDIKITETESTSSALAIVREQKFDVVICAEELSGISGQDYFASIKKTALNEKTAFLMITTSKSPDKLDELKNQGINNFLVTPFSSAELTVKINEICNPKHWRSESRYSIPGTTARIFVNNIEIQANVLNLSKSGLLCDLVYQKDYIGFLRPGHLSVLLPSDFTINQVDNIPGKMLRLDVLNWHEDMTPSHVRTVWSFMKMNEDVQERLEQVLDTAESKKHILQ